MNKSVAVFNLNLPTDILHSICEFIYYSYDQCIKKQRDIIINLNNIIMANRFVISLEYLTNYKIIIGMNTNNLQIQMVICKLCGNYKITGSGIIHKNCLCLCNNDDDIIHIKLDNTTYEARYIE